MSEDQLHEILSEVDLNKNAQVDLGEFLQVTAAHILILLFSLAECYDDDDHHLAFHCRTLYSYH